MEKKIYITPHIEVITIDEDMLLIGSFGPGGGSGSVGAKELDFDDDDEVLFDIFE